MNTWLFISPMPMPHMLQLLGSFLRSERCLQLSNLNWTYNIPRTSTFHGQGFWSSFRNFIFFFSQNIDVMFLRSKDFRLHQSQLCRSCKVSPFAGQLSVFWPFLLFAYFWFGTLGFIASSRGPPFCLVIRTLGICCEHSPKVRIGPSS